MTFSVGSRRVLHRLMKRAGGGSQTRSHHPDPFNPKTTRGWKAALAVSCIDGGVLSVCFDKSSCSFIVVLSN